MSAETNRAGVRKSGDPDQIRTGDLSLSGLLDLVC
ncbi:uncharacterized protein METZ01_LOCUS168654 [marine metagenome]|uniref:Uncharacterized protein n=1 Tax=marine metagenome TaxID=408172 RepID=A0A382BPN3_9ZZZZ